MPDDPVDNVRRLLAREGVSATDTELQFVAAVASVRRRIDPQPESEPHLTLQPGPWKAQ